jgi:hypothetical protein
VRRRGERGSGMFADWFFHARYVGRGRCRRWLRWGGLRECTVGQLAARLRARIFTCP